MRKVGSYAVLTVIALVFLLASLFMYSVLYGMCRRDATAPALLGNRPEVIARLTEGRSDPRPFSFLVVGDIHSRGSFMHFCENMSAEDLPDFGIIVGDFVGDPELNRHRLFVDEFYERGMRFPLLLVAGNHDILTRHTQKPDRLHDLFLQQDFEGMYGPTNFSFTYRGCLFIGLNDLYGTGYLDYARDILSLRPPEIAMTFVFMHIPPPSLSVLVRARGVDGEKEFMRLMEKSGVDYVFTGDFHSYYRGNRNHTNYIVTGGGGGPLYGGTARSFYHAVLMTVDPAKRQVDEIIYPLRPALDLRHDMGLIVMWRIYPLFEGRPLVWVTLFAIVMAVTAGLSAGIIMRFVGKRPGRTRLNA